MYFKTCWTLYESLSLHCGVARSGGLTLTLVPFPLNTNSRQGVLIALDEEAMVITVDLSQVKWWFSFTKQDWLLPEKLIDFWLPLFLWWSSIWSTDKIGGSTLYFAFPKYLTVQTLFENWIIILSNFFSYRKSFVCVLQRNIVIFAPLL